MPGSLNGDPVLCKINAHGMYGTGIARRNNFDLQLDRDPRVTAAFALHQRPNRTEIGFRSLQSDRLIKDEMGPLRECSIQCKLAINNGYNHGALVCRGRTGGFEHSRSNVLVRAVNDHGFKALPGDLLHCRIRIQAMFYPDL
jgi:hypothetical protein